MGNLPSLSFFNTAKGEEEPRDQEAVSGQRPVVSVLEGCVIS